MLTNSFFHIGKASYAPKAKRLLGSVENRGNKSVLVEAVDADWIEPLLGDGANPSLWRERGPDAPVSVLEFNSDDWRRLLESPPSYNRPQYITRHWFEFRVGNGGRPVSQFTNLYSEPRQIPVDRIMTVERARAAALERLLHLRPYWSDKNTIESVLPNEDSIIDWVAVYDVGQGTANGLLDHRGIPCAYVDLGGGVLNHHATFPTAFNRLCLSMQPPVIMSHWDWDHWSSGGRFPLSQTLNWIVPDQNIGVVHGVFASLILQNGHLFVWPSGLPQVRRGQITIEKCTGTGGDRNHSGLAVSVAGPNGQPPILLPGDARYSAIPSGAGVHHAVVVPHHGADMGSRTMPSSAGALTSRVAYSYGHPNQYGHPKGVTQNLHNCAGWPHGPAPGVGVDRHTAFRTNGLGHIGLNWRGGMPPQPPCGGVCNQMIIQT